MWKIENIYSDGSKNTLTGTKKVAMNKRLANHYWMLYGKSAEESYFQQYPKKKYEKNRVREISGKKCRSRII